MNPLDAHELDQQGREALALIARYWDAIQSDAPPPVTPGLAPGDVLATLPAVAPRQPQPWTDILADLQRLILPALTHWQHPHFYAFFPANISTPAVIGELLAAGLGQQGMLWATSPACTELEIRVLDWLARAMALPDAFLSTSPSGGGVIQGTASEATLAALLAARRRATDAWSAAGKPGKPHLTLYASTQAHSSVVKAAMIAGLADHPDDRTHLRLVDVDLRTHAMRPDALHDALRDDLARGHVPALVAATLGTTGSTAIDPIDDLHRTIAQAFAADPRLPHPWLHVDAAHAGACLLCPELRWMARGIEHADSFCFNPHKWLLTNFDCDCFWTRDRRALIASMAITPDYLRNPASASGHATDFRDWHVPLGRRFRSLKLWLVLRRFGLDALADYVRAHVGHAAWFESKLAAHPAFTLAAPRTCNLVCFRLADEDPDRAASRTRELVDRLNASRRLYLTHAALPTELGPRYAARFCVGSATTQRHHVEHAWTLIRDAANS